MGVGGGARGILYFIGVCMAASLCKNYRETSATVYRTPAGCSVLVVGAVLPWT